MPASVSAWPWKKADFIGKTALARIKADGPQWKLCSFTIDAGRPVMMQGSAPIVCDGEVIGTTTSAGYGHTVGKTICYGYIPAAYADRTDGFEIENYKEIHKARKEPGRVLVDPEKKKIMA